MQSDGGGEYIGKQFQAFLAERKHRHIIKTTLTLLQIADLSGNFWFFAVQTSVYLINRMPFQTLNQKSPFEALYEYAPNVHHLKIFGCFYYPLLRPLNTSKLQPRTTKCIFLGYASKY